MQNFSNILFSQLGQSQSRNLHSSSKSKNKQNEQFSNAITQNPNKKTDEKENINFQQSIKSTRISIKDNFLQNSQQNQFITPFTSIKNDSELSYFEDVKTFSQRILTQKNINETQKSLDQRNQDHSVLLDSETYKQICIQQDQKKVNTVSVLQFQSVNYLQNFCQVHQKPLQIVCLNQKCLICSHCAIFGEHKSHFMAPLQQFQQFTELKKLQVNKIIEDHKKFQLKIKQKSFISQYSERINEKKNKVKRFIEKQFHNLKSLLDECQQKANRDIQAFYQIVWKKMDNALKNSYQGSSKATYQKWQTDARQVLQQMNYTNVSQQSKIKLFLNNFNSTSLYSSCQVLSRDESMISLEDEGQKYFSQLKEELNLNLTNLMQIVEGFKVQKNQSIKQNLRKTFIINCSLNAQQIIMQNNLNSLKQKIICQQSVYQEFQKELNKFKLPDDQFNFSQMQNQFTTAMVNLLKTSKITQLQSSHSIKSPINKYIKSPQKYHDHKLSNVKKSNNKKETLQSFKQTDFTNSSSYFEQMKNVNNNSVHRRPNGMNNVSETQGFYAKENSMVNTDSFVSTGPRLFRCRSKDAIPNHQLLNQKQERIINSIKSQNQTKSRQPVLILENFKKSCSEVLDLSNCKLNDTQIIYFVQKASKIRKLKCLNIQSNFLTSSGLEKIIPYLSLCQLLNLAKNKLFQNSLELLLLKKERLPYLKMLKFSQNKSNQRKLKEKIDSFFKIGIKVII